VVHMLYMMVDRPRSWYLNLMGRYRKVDLVGLGGEMLGLLKLDRMGSMS